MSKHISWVSIESFYHVRKHVDAYPTLLPQPGPVTYRAKVKLHGTCAGVIVEPDGTVTAMSRSAIITPENDNAGFAKWVQERREAFAAEQLNGATLIIFGEWCGPGIQKGVAVNKLPERSFAVFAARSIAEGSEEFMTEPWFLEGRLKNVPGAYVLPWFNDGEEFVIDWQLPAEQLQPVIDRINERVLAVEACDPWVKSVCGEEGVGEGLVFYPVSETHSNYKCFSDLCFKAKGAKHQVVAKAKPAQADPQAAANAAAFAEMVVTPARLEQGCRAANGGELVFESKNIGTFLAWIGRDVIKECNVEMQASGLEQKDAVRACSNRARVWYLDGMKKL